MKCRLRYCAECGYCITSLYVGLDVSDTQPICCSLQPEAGWIQIRIRSLTSRIIITWDVSCYVDTAVFGLVGRKKIVSGMLPLPKIWTELYMDDKILIIIYFDNKNKKTIRAWLTLHFWRQPDTVLRPNKCRLSQILLVNSNFTLEALCNTLTRCIDVKKMSQAPGSENHVFLLKNTGLYSEQCNTDHTYLPHPSILIAEPNLSLVFNRSKCDIQYTWWIDGALDHREGNSV